MTSKTPETNFCHPLLPLCFEAAALVMVSLRSSLSSAALGPAFGTSTLMEGDALAAAVESWIRGCAARRTTVLNDARSMVSTNVEQSFADRIDRWCYWRRVCVDQQTDLMAMSHSKPGFSRTIWIPGVTTRRDGSEAAI